MEDPNIYKRPALPLRPWITGKLYDDLTRVSILHCDAYIFIKGKGEYLQIEWRVGGQALLAIDTWLIERGHSDPVTGQATPDGLTPVWDIQRRDGVLTYNRDPALHARVIAQAHEAESAGRWARVSVLCHYVDQRGADPEAGLGTPKPPLTRRKRGVPEAGNLPDIL